jgi:hypothetical protein
MSVRLDVITTRTLAQQFWYRVGLMGTDSRTTTGRVTLFIAQRLQGLLVVYKCVYLFFRILCETGLP